MRLQADRHPVFLRRDAQPIEMNKREVNHEDTFSDVRFVVRSGPSCDAGNRDVSSRGPEIVGLVVGFLSRVAAFGVACVMVGAIWLVHWPNGFFMNWSGKQAGEGFEYHLLVIAISLALMIAGSGKWSVDRIIAGKMKH